MGLLILFFYILAATFVICDPTDGIHSPKDEKYHKDLVERINGKRKRTWTAEYNRYADTKDQVHNSDLSLYPSESFEQLLAADPTNLHETEEQFRYLARYSLQSFIEPTG